MKRDRKGITIQRRRSMLRRGVTLVELLMATMVMAMIAGALGALTRSVQMSSDYSHGHGMATQHARVAIERINRAVRQAAAADENPGLVVLHENVGAWRFPDTLVVWKEDSNADKLPQVDELVVFCPNPENPAELWELSTRDDRNDSTQVRLTDNVTLRDAVDDLKEADDSLVDRVVLTDFLRFASTKKDGREPRGALRFEVELAPTADEWTGYQDDDLSWSELSWGQGLNGSKIGLRQVSVRYEIQLMPGDYRSEAANHIELAIPFLGSATLCYKLEAK